MGAWGGSTAGGKDKEGVINVYPNPHRGINRIPEINTLNLTGAYIDYLNMCRHRE